MKSIHEILKDEELERAAKIKAHNERPINWESSFIARDIDGSPMVCDCGDPVGTDYPYPVAMVKPSCYHCVTKWMLENNVTWPEELKPDETNNAAVMGQQRVRETKII